jgi:hypothetical protein
LVRVVGGFGETEVEDFDGAIGAELDVAGFEIAVDDAFFVGGFEGVGDLAGDVEGFVAGDGALAKALGERGAFDEFHDEVVGADVVEVADVRMIEGGDEAGFAGGAFGELGGANFNGDVAMEAGIVGAPDFAHAARAERGEDLVGAEAVAWREGHSEIVQEIEMACAGESPEKAGLAADEHR